MQKLSLLVIVLTLIGCSATKTQNSKKIQLQFLDEYILSDTLTIDQTVVGGLSGIDYYNDTYYLACDDARNPRYYTAKIDINQRKINTITIENVILIKDTTHFLDLESIRYDKTLDQVFMTSEGHINKQRNPSFFSINSKDNHNNYIEIPNAFFARSKQEPRHNGTLEGLSESIDGKGFWLAMELPLKADGPEPELKPTDSPVRITYIDTETNKATKQFAYKLDAVAKQPKGNFFVNGLTDILAYDKNSFFVIERSYSSGLGNQGNTIRIYSANTSLATNTLEMGSLKDAKYIAASKELLFDFEEVRSQLTNKSIDNIEGICFGSTLANGNKTLLLVSDNNFNTLGEQLNQFILLEVKF